MLLILTDNRLEKGREVRDLRKVIVIALVALLASTTLALAAWKIVDVIRGEDGDSPGVQASSTTGGKSTEAQEEESEGAPGADEASAAGAEAAALRSGDDLAQTSPDQRYVTETQRHQNFFVAVAEGRVKRLDAVATDYQPAGDPNTSNVYFSMTTTDGGTHNGTMVLRQEGGMWRIGAIRGLTGDLGGGTSYPVPASFEADLAREIAELQDFLTKLAQGRFDYMVWDKLDRASDQEVVLTGRVVGVSGKVFNTQMTLRKDYCIWHLTDIREIKP